VILVTVQIPSAALLQFFNSALMACKKTTLTAVQSISSAVAF